MASKSTPKRLPQLHDDGEDEIPSLPRRSRRPDSKTEAQPVRRKRNRNPPNTTTSNHPKEFAKSVQPSQGKEELMSHRQRRQLLQQHNSDDSNEDEDLFSLDYAVTQPGAQHIEGTIGSTTVTATDTTTITSLETQDPVARQREASAVMIQAELAPDIDNVVAAALREEQERRAEAIEDALRRERQEALANIVKADVVEEDNCFCCRGASKRARRIAGLLIVGILLIVGGIVAAVLATTNATPDSSDNATPLPSSAPTREQNGATIPPVIEPDTPLYTDEPTPSPTSTPEWVQLGTDHLGPELNDRFGAWLSLSADGIRVAISAPESRMVYLYEINADGTLISFVDAYENSVWGLLSGDGKTFVLGESFNINQSLGPGEIHFEGYFSSDAKEDIATGSVYGARFDIYTSGVGVDVSYNGTIAAVASSGSSFVDEKARIRVYSSNTQKRLWTQLGDDIIADSFHVESLALNDDGTILAMVTSVLKVYKYNPADNEWEPLGNDTVGYFSQLSMSSDGLTIAVSSEAWEVNHVTRVYAYNNTLMQWIQRGEELEPDDDHPDYNLNQVALSGDGETVALSTRNGNSNDIQNAVLGYVRVYRWSEKEHDWVPLGDRIRGKSIVEFFGFNLALSHDGTRLVVGAPGTEEVPSISGLVRVFQLE